MHLPELIRAAFVIARRDFTATVLRKTFLLFLIGPLFPVAMGFGFGGMGAKLAEDNAQPAVAVIASPADFAPLQQARDRLAQASEGDPVALIQVAPEPDLAAQHGAVEGVVIIDDRPHERELALRVRV